MLSILVADDHELIRSSLRHLLEMHDSWRVCGEAANGRDAVERARELKPDVAILDVRMPELDGLEATRRIRTACPETEILILTGYGTDHVLHDALSAGAHGVALKDTGTAEIVVAVEALAQHQTYVSASIPQNPPRRRSSRAERLSPREREVAALLAEGKTNGSIATILGISVKTVETHRANLLDKLGLESVVELVRYAVRNQMIEP